MVKGIEDDKIPASKYVDETLSNYVSIMVPELKRLDHVHMGSKLPGPEMETEIL